MSDREERGVRFQDLSRAQAYAVEARVLQRIVPLLTPRDEADTGQVQKYFLHLFDLVHILAEIGLGNQTAEQTSAKGKELHEAFLANELFIDKSMQAAAGVPLVTDALAQLGLVRYLWVPGLPERDKLNGDLTNLVGGGAQTMQRWGLLPSAFKEPVIVDCGFVFQHRRQSGEFVDEEFFSRVLWPDVPFALERVIVGEWKEYMGGRGLQGIVASYEAYANGMHLTQRDRSVDKGRTMTVNNVTLNFSNGSSFTGPLAVGENIRIAYDAAAAAPKDELRERLENVVKTITSLTEKLEQEEEKIDVSTQLKAFVEEAKKDKPSKWMLRGAAEGMIDFAKKVASMVVPVSEAITAVMALVGT